MDLRLSAPAVVAILALTGCAPEGGNAGVDLAAEEAALRSISTSWQGFDEEQNAAGVAGLFAPDGTVIWEQRSPISGLAAVEAFMAEAYAFDPANEGSWAPDSYDIAASGDLALERGTYQGPGGGGAYMTLYRKVAGDWKIAADMSMSTAPNGGAPTWAVELLREWYDAFNSRDAERLADTYASDARIRDAEGRAAIIARFRTAWAEENERCSGGFDGFEVRGPIASGWGRDTCTSTDQEGNPATSRGSWLAVYEQQEDGSWLCIRDFGEPVE